MKKLGLFALCVTLIACGRSEAPGTADAPATSDSPTLGPLISGKSSWVSGTHAWTDYAYDDRGGSPGASYPGGVYPSDDLANSADLIQLQLGLDGKALRIRAVLETLTDPTAPLLGVGIDTDGNPATGAASLPGWNTSGAPLGLERLVLVSEAGTRVLAWNGSEWIERVSSPAKIDTETNTLDGAVTLTDIGGGNTWRVVGALGLASQSWAEGAGAIYDLAYVRDLSTASWQSGLQADILNGDEDAAQAVATIALSDLRQRRTELAQPEAGVKETFLYRSRLKLGEGIGGADRKYAGPYQPYGAWFPENLPQPPPLIVFMHGALQNHLTGPYGDSGNILEIGPLSLGPGSMSPAAVIVTPLGRGEAFGWYMGASAQDVLDVTADAQQRFGGDPDRTVLSGYSLGGVGTFNLAQLYPDRWAGAIDIVGAPDLGIVELLGIAPPLPYTLENLRNLPFRMGHARADELELIVGVIQPDLAALQLQQLGYDYRYWQFYLREHLTFPVKALQCEFEAAIARGRVINPARVVYSQQPALRRIEPESGLVQMNDSAYWMSELVVRGESFAAGDKGTVDITSLALPDREPQLRNIVAIGENLTAGRDVCGENPEVRTNDVWTVVGQAWEGFAEQPLSNGMVVKLTRVASVRLDLGRMGIDPARAIDIQASSDGESLLRLGADCFPGGVLEAPVTPGESTVRLNPVAGCR